MSWLPAKTTERDPSAGAGREETGDTGNNIAAGQSAGWQAEGGVPYNQKSCSCNLDEN